MDLDGRPHGPQRVILVHLGDAEDSQHRIAGPLLDRPAVTLNGRAHAGEIAPKDLLERLRVELLAEGGGTATSENSTVTTLSAASVWSAVTNGVPQLAQKREPGRFSCWQLAQVTIRKGDDCRLRGCVVVETG